MSGIDGFVHRPGDHCGSTSLRNLADHYDWGFDEATAFGLASGLGFTYFELPDSPHRAFFGRPLWLEVAFFEHVGVGFDVRGGVEWPAVWDTIRSSIDDGDPVLVFTDIYYLDYFDTDTHFVPHSLLVVGYDESGGEATVTLSDNEFDEPQTLPAARLQAAMDSEYMLPERMRRLLVTDPERDRSFAAAAADAVRETAAYMLDPTTARHELGPGKHGLAGVRAVAADLPQWTSLSDPQWTVRFAYQNVERRGTGGGCFRRLYADFLDTAAASEAPVPAEAAERMHDIAADWTAAGETLRDASERDPADMRPLLEDAADDLRAIADREERLFADLRDRLE